MRCLLLLASLGLVAAENGLNAWLRYAPLPRGTYSHVSLPSDIIALNSSQTSPVYTAGQELAKGFEGIFGKHVSVSHKASKASSCLVVGTIDEYEKSYGKLKNAPELKDDGYWLSNKGSTIQILGQNERGALYGAFQYLSMLAQGDFSKVAYASSPATAARWVNQWDNMDGSIERGYGGASIFFSNGLVVDDLTRAGDYARILASIGVNTVVVNNVNANVTTLSTENIKGLGRIADVFRPYGVQLGLSLNFAAPNTSGTAIPPIGTYDPLDPKVVAWWTNMTELIYDAVPDMAGYLVKADSEGQPGPLVYNRTLSDGANLFARPLQPHGGIVMFRAFVYNLLNESDWKADRAKAAVDFFKDLDGKFEDNVVIQIKFGPIDFQVREPTSPLFANLFKTPTAIELEVAQEYLGQQCHLVYLPPLWKTVLDFDLRVQNKPSLVRNIISGERFNHKLGGTVAVVNVGTNTTWLGSHLAMSNLYAFGRLAWNADQDPQDILQDWIRLTFNGNPTVVDSITQMSMESWPAYENYSGNLGIQTLTDILFNHYGPRAASQELNGYAQWTRADHDSVGMDRTLKNGTGYSRQYPDEIYNMYENIDTTPDNLLLWFHHVNWTHQLHSGKTVIQHFYDAHYDGSNMAQTFVPTWETLKGKIDNERYNDVLFRQTYQAGHSLVWRDSIVNYFHNMTSIPDKHGRVGNHPWRIEAEDMELDGYKVYQVNPFEAASNANAIVTITNSTTGTATTKLKFESGTYDFAVNYFDQIGGKATWKAYIDDRLVAEWIGNMEDTLGHAPSPYLDSSSAIRKTWHGVKIKKGDTLKIVGKADGIEPAGVDYVSFLPKGIVD
ncbi:alpha-glucuronidase [Rhizodiscina lignyota]|uniref:Alpha-glucuronidase n=1 Tax=Rhizodiscina lignyota TaxID=1504668 RepID=A0A9P4I4P4_9PEZI|nr:alpha-glucuronidase [Rhizodiscina lignyota]